MNFDSNAVLYNGEYNDGEPASGIPASLITARWMNALTKELNAVCVAAGIAPDIDTHNQVLTSIQALYQQYVNQQISNLVSSSPTTLDTLNELAVALGNDPNFATTIANQLGLKADTTYVDSQVATKTDQAYVNQQVSNLVASSPAALNTLNELAVALGNDPNFATTIASQIGLKADTTYVDSQVATKTDQAYVNQQVSNLVASSPAALNTLNELAVALGNDPNFAVTMTNLIATKITQAQGDGRYSLLAHTHNYSPVGHGHTSSSLSSTGYSRNIDSGFTIQWTTTPAMAPSGSYIWTFPTAFVSTCFGVVGNTKSASVFGGTVEINTSVISRFQCQAIRDGESGGGTSQAFLWAIGV